jgi:hypothetical protein
MAKSSAHARARRDARRDETSRHGGELPRVAGGIEEFVVGPDPNGAPSRRSVFERSGGRLGRGEAEETEAHVPASFSCAASQAAYSSSSSSFAVRWRSMSGFARAKSW